jgi:uncharacterized LabA/DUF88 family protein
MDRAIFFIDARNLLGGRDEHRKISAGYDFGYEQLVTFLGAQYKVIRGYYYDGAEHHSQRSAGKRQFFDLLRKLGITLRLKEIDFRKPNHSQKGVDIFLTADMISLAYEDAYDTAVLLSGDGDYVALVDLVKSKGKRVIVISFQNCLATSLRECADAVITFETTPALRRNHTATKP